MSLSKPNSCYQNVEQSENLRRHSRSTPIACRVCDRVFFDNVSLVLHFECHLEDEISNPRQHGRDLASLQGGRHLSLSLSQLSSSSSSSAERMNEACHAVFPRMNDFLRPWPLPVSSVITPNTTPRDVSLVHIPVLNSMPPINSSFDARWNLSQLMHRSTMGHSVEQPISHLTMGHYRATSSSAHPLMHSQLGARRLASGSSLLPPLRRGLNGGQGFSSDYKNPQIKQCKKSIQEIIVISDDEDDDNNAAEIDLTLRL